MIQENPEYRNRSHYLQTAYALKDGLLAIKDRRPGGPMWFHREMNTMIRHANELICLAAEHLDEALHTIED